MMSIAITLHQHAIGLHDNLLAREESVASIDSVVLVPAPRLPSCASAGSCEPRQGLTQLAHMPLNSTQRKQTGAELGEKVI